MQHVLRVQSYSILKKQQSLHPHYFHAFPHKTLNNEEKHIINGTTIAHIQKIITIFATQNNGLNPTRREQPTIISSPLTYTKQHINKPTMDINTENNLTEEKIKEDLRYLQLLAQSYPNVAEASYEIINLEAVLNLPKPTEHFISDPHGESEAFNHVLRNASGYVKRKVDEIFGPTLRMTEKQELCTLIYYPEAKLQRIKPTETNMTDFYIITLNQLIRVLREVSSKYTRTKIRQELPEEIGDIIEELLHESHSGVGDKRHQYYNMIVQTIIDTQRADHFIVSICNLIQRLAIDRLHLLGDIFDRGPGAHLIMETLMHYHNFDIVWGNHDITQAALVQLRTRKIFGKNIL